VPTPEPTPAPVPSFEVIASQLAPWWERLTLAEGADMLNSVSFFAQRYLEHTTGSFVSTNP
jgi:hypothetical protein